MPRRTSMHKQSVLRCHAQGSEEIREERGRFCLTRTKPATLARLRGQYGRMPSGRLAYHKAHKDRPFPARSSWLTRYKQRHEKPPECRHQNCLYKVDEDGNEDKEGRNIKEGDIIISRGKGHVYHLACWNSTIDPRPI